MVDIFIKEEVGGRGLLGSQRDGIPCLGEPSQLRRNAGEGRDQEGRSERGSTCSMSLPGFRSSRSSTTPTSPGWRLSSSSSSTTTAAALTSDIPAVVMICFVLVECFGWQESASPKPSSPWNVGDFL